MKNYDLSQYVLRQGDIIMFPLTKDEVLLLKNGKQQFEEYFKMPYVAGQLATGQMQSILNNLNMLDDYWFLNSLWVVMHAPSKEIFGTIRYLKQDNTSKVIKNITVLSDCQETYLQATELFVRFLSVNNFKNIVIENEKDIIWK